VPRELEDFWPAAHYDIPVTGDWDEGELIIIRNMVSNLVGRVCYSDVINHSGLEINVHGANVHDTRMGDTAGSEQSLARLEETTRDIASSLGLVDLRQNDERLSIMESRSRFIHGSDDWLKDSVVSGRPPILTITKSGEQLARWNPRDGRFAFSKKALQLLESNDSMPRAHLAPNHKWVGDLFPTNVEEFQGEIRVGDEVLVYQDGKLVGSARAVAPQWEWPLGPGRLARTRHRL